MIWIALLFLGLMLMAILVETGRRAPEYLWQIADGVLYLADLTERVVLTAWGFFFWPNYEWPTEPASCHVGCQCKVCHFVNEVQLTPKQVAILKAHQEGDTNDVY